MRELVGTDELKGAKIRNSDPTGHPQGSHRIIDCFGVVLREEWWHHQYATRDLTQLGG